jgi:DNA-binding NarL/FixJ family response regulator
MKTGPTSEGVQRMRVLVVDDHPLVREWLTNLINQQPDMTVCAEAADTPEALRVIAGSPPDVAIVDISLKTRSGLELIKELKARFPDVAVLVLSMHDESLYAERALRAGARGYIMKRETTSNVIAAIRRVAGGGLYLSESCAVLMAKRNVQSSVSASPIGRLSDRELEVFGLLGQGNTTRQIAETLGVSANTVQIYCARIKAKLHLGTATELLREAIRWHEERGGGG